MDALSTQLYSLIQGFEDFEAETAKLRTILEARLGPGLGAVLNVGCGCGGHIPWLKQWCDIEGADSDSRNIATARQREPDVLFHRIDPANFDLGREYDAVLCLAGAIGRASTVNGLRQTIACMARHVRPGGLLVVEPWRFPDPLEDGRIVAGIDEISGMKMARMSRTALEDGVCVYDHHYLIGAPGGIQHFVERREYGLFFNEDYRVAFEAANMEVVFDPRGHSGRGLYFGSHASASVECVETAEAVVHAIGGIG